MYFAASFVIGENNRLGRAIWGHDERARLDELIAQHKENGYIQFPETFYNGATFRGNKIVAMLLTPFAVYLYYSVGV